MRAFPKELRKRFAAFKMLASPQRIQDFLDRLPINFEKKGDTLRSPLQALKHKEAHCFEGALIAAAALWFHGAPPLLLDLKTSRHDDSHVVALFKRRGLWGSISKTNHAVLRYRDPIFKTPRELALSYFNEYFLDSGKKTLKSFSKPFDLSRQGDEWLTDVKDLWYLDNALEDSPHTLFIPGGNRRFLRRADSIEIKAGKLTEWRS